MTITECGMVVHPKCAPGVPATCGLPTEYVRHFADMMCQIEEAELGSSSNTVNIKMEGWLKVPRLVVFLIASKYALNCLFCGTVLQIFVGLMSVKCYRYFV